MKNLKSMIVFVLALLMCCGLLVIPSMAANDYGVTYSAVIDTPSISVSSEDQTINVTIKASKNVDLDSITAQAGMPTGLTLTAITNETLGFTGGNINKNNGMIAWSYDYEDADYLTTDVLAVVTYTVPANTSAGTYEIEFHIIDITNEWGTTWENGTTVSTTLTIKEPTPEHTCTPTLVSGQAPACEAAGWKDYYECADETCSKTYSDAAGKNEITDIFAWKSGDGAIPATDHNMQMTADQVDATCEVAGKTAVYTCANGCGKTEGGAEIPATEHAYGTAVTGWYELNGDWYYGDMSVCDNDESHIKHTPVTGVTRVPYPTVAINGVTYAPNAADKAYWEANKDTSAYTDAETALFIFGNDGKFKYEVTGVGPHISGDDGVYSYAVKGMIPWHVGFVKVGEDYYYFKGDVNGGGNVMATGMVYATRDYDSGLTVGSTAIYFFGENGKLLKNEGVASVNGNLYYFDTYRLALGAGLIKLDDGYVFVRGSGMLAVGEYWVPAEKTNGLPVKGGKCYTFDENGYLQNAIDPNKNGIIDGYYYVDGEPYYAGLIEIDGDIYYVNFKGQVVTGTYYVTKTNDMEGFAKGDKLIFGDDGKMETIKNGIVEEGGVLYYYENNHIKYAGLIEIDGDIYYVNSKGQVVTGKYYVTKVNGLEGYTAGQKLYFGEDGKLILAD